MGGRKVEFQSTVANVLVDTTDINVFDSQHLRDTILSPFLFPLDGIVE
jgi:hypothetical protein